MSDANERYSILSKIMKATGLKKRSAAPAGPMVRLMGMSGTFGNGEVRHCSTWNFESGIVKSETLGRATNRAVRQRRIESLRSLSSSGKGIFNDINNR